MRRLGRRDGPRRRLRRDGRCRRGHTALWRRGAWLSRPGRLPLDWWRMNDDSAWSRTERDAERACRPREETRDQRAAGDRSRQEERRDHALHPLHAFPYPAWSGIGLPVLLPQLGSENLRRYLCS